MKYILCCYPIVYIQLKKYDTTVIGSFITVE